MRYIIFEYVIPWFLVLCLGVGIVFAFKYGFEKEDEIYRGHNQEMNVPVDHRGLEQ